MKKLILTGWRQIFGQCDSPRDCSLLDWQPGDQQELWALLAKWRLHCLCWAQDKWADGQDIWRPTWGASKGVPSYRRLEGPQVHCNNPWIFSKKSCNWHPPTNVDCCKPCLQSFGIAQRHTHYHSPFSTVLVWPILEIAFKRSDLFLLWSSISTSPTSTFLGMSVDIHSQIWSK